MTWLPIWLRYLSGYSIGCAKGLITKSPIKPLFTWMENVAITSRRTTFDSTRQVLSPSFFKLIFVCLFVCLFCFVSKSSTILGSTCQSSPPPFTPPPLFFAGKSSRTILGSTCQAPLFSLPPSPHRQSLTRHKFSPLFPLLKSVTKHTIRHIQFFLCWKVLQKNTIRHIKFSLLFPLLKSVTKNTIRHIKFLPFVLCWKVFRNNAWLDTAGSVRSTDSHTYSRMSVVSCSYIQSSFVH